MRHRATPGRSSAANTSTTTRNHPSTDSGLELGKIREPFAGLWGSVVERILRSRLRRFDDHFSTEVLSYRDGLTNGGDRDRGDSRRFGRSLYFRRAALCFSIVRTISPRSMQRWRRRSAERAASLLIEGPPGIGKTALLDGLRETCLCVGNDRAGRTWQGNSSGGSASESFANYSKHRCSGQTPPSALGCWPVRLRLSEPVFTEIRRGGGAQVMSHSPLARPVLACRKHHRTRPVDP